MIDKKLAENITNLDQKLKRRMDWDTEDRDNKYGTKSAATSSKTLISIKSESKDENPPKKAVKDITDDDLKSMVRKKIKRPEKENDIKFEAIPRPKPKPRIVPNRRKETRTVDEFQFIGSGLPKARADSAGHVFDARYHLRTPNREALRDALLSGDLPLGSLNALPIGQRIESRIYRILENDEKEYKQQCIQCVTFLRDKQNREYRHSLLIGRLDPEDFAFMPLKDKRLSKIIKSRIESKEVQEMEKMKQLRNIARS